MIYKFQNFTNPRKHLYQFLKKLFLSSLTILFAFTDRWHSEISGVTGECLKLGCLIKSKMKRFLGALVKISPFEDIYDKKEGQVNTSCLEA